MHFSINEYIKYKSPCESIDFVVSYSNKMTDFQAVLQIIHEDGTCICSLWLINVSTSDLN